MNNLLAGSGINTNGMRLRCDFTLTEALGQFILWLFLFVITLGIAGLFLPYYVLKSPINNTFLIDGSGATVGRLHVDVNFSAILGHAIIWIFLILFTLGLAYLIYWPAVIRRMLNGVVIKH